MWLTKMSAMKTEFKGVSMTTLKCFLLLIPIEFIDHISQKLDKWHSVSVCYFVQVMLMDL